MTINNIIINLAQQIQNPILTNFSKFIAITADPLTLLILAIIISAILYLNKKKTQAILLASTTIFTAAIIKIIKATLKNPRPTSMLIQETGFSFPSGHTTFAIVFFGLLAFIFTKGKHKTMAITTSILLILIISFTRLYLQVHWLTDIIGGLIIGALILLLSILIYKKLSN